MSVIDGAARLRLDCLLAGVELTSTADRRQRGLGCGEAWIGVLEESGPEHPQATELEIREPGPIESYLAQLIKGMIELNVGIEYIGDAWLPLFPAC